MHFPLQCSFVFNVLTHEKVNDENFEFRRTFHKYRWRDDYKDTFMIEFLEQYEDKREAILGFIEENIDEGVKEIVNIYFKASEGIKVKAKINKHQQKKTL